MSNSILNKSTDLAITRTKLANERTYLAYMRTGFAIATVAGVFKKKWIVFFGIFIICVSTIHYYAINHILNDERFLENKIQLRYNNFLKLFSFLPILYGILSLGVLRLQFKKETNIFKK